jgi:hypothetical protein
MKFLARALRISLVIVCFIDMMEAWLQSFFLPPISFNFYNAIPNEEQITRTGNNFGVSNHYTDLLFFERLERVLRFESFGDFDFDLEADPAFVSYKK